MLLATFLAAASAVDMATAGTGDLDQSFGVGGVVTRAFPTSVRGSEVLVQPDGRIVTVSVLRAAVSPAGGIGMARYLADGTLDQSFGTGGLVTLPLSSVSSWSPSGLLQPDGKIVASIDGAPGVLLVRYHEDGTPDAGFGAGGQIVLPGWGYPNSMVLHQGRLLVSMIGPSGPELRRFALLDGSPDAGFGTAGVVTGVSITEGSNVGSLAVQPDDKVLITSSSLRVARVNPDGSPDASFGSGGVASLTLPAACPDSSLAEYFTTGLALQADGRIVVLGYPGCRGIAMARYLPNGAPDPTFGTAGLVRSGPVELFPFRYGNRATDLVIEPDGRLIVVGETGPSFSEVGLLVARFAPDGTLDRTFGAGGRTVSWVGRDGVAVSAGALQSDGKLVVVAKATGPLVVARYDLACPALPDGDGDGLGDACDPCTNPVAITAPNVKVTHLAAPAGDELVRISGRLSIPLTPAIDPATRGIRVALSDGTGAELLYGMLDPNAILPDPALTTPKTGVVWRADRVGRTHTFEPPDWISPPAGIERAVVRVLPGTSQVRFKALARGITFPLAPGQLPLELLLTLDARRSADGRCGMVRFDAPGSDCVFARFDDVLVCR